MLCGDWSCTWWSLWLPSNSGRSMILWLSILFVFLALIYIVLCQSFLTTRPAQSYTLSTGFFLQTQRILRLCLFWRYLLKIQIQFCSRSSKQSGSFQTHCMWCEMFFSTLEPWRELYLTKREQCEPYPAATIADMRLRKSESIVSEGRRDIPSRDNAWLPAELSLGMLSHEAPPYT